VGEGTPPARPAIQLSNSALLVNGPRAHRIGTEIAQELRSADRVDLLCSFLFWTGLRVIRDALLAFPARPASADGPHGRPRLRVLTTCYRGATERRVLDQLVRLGRAAAGTEGAPAVEVRVSYDKRRTRLHAKAWLFHRATGYDTAFIGSSNLSTSALLDGLEWNVRVSGVDAPQILRKFQATFDSYWEDRDFEPYCPQHDAERFDRAVAAERAGPSNGDDARLALVDDHPYPFQRGILERLLVERETHGRRRIATTS
jgi:HKD family nuclease